MFEEEVIETPEAEAEVQPEPAPEITEAQVAAYLEAQGIDLKKAKHLTDWEKEVNTKSSDLGRIARELEASRTAPKKEDDGLDDETKSELKKALKAVGNDPDEVRAFMQEYREEMQAQREDIFAEFTAANPDLPEDKLIAELFETIGDPNKVKPSLFKMGLRKAAKAVQAASLDPEAIKKAAVAEYLEGLAKKGVKPDEITEVKKGRGSAAGAHRTIEEVLADPNASAFDKMMAAQGMPDD